MHLWAIILIAIVAVMTIIVVTVIYVREQDRKKLEYMLDAFEDNELNFRFQDNSRFNKTLNRIKWILERKRQQDEQESWTKLIRVLTHEIMNTVSPIASLSEALSHWANVPEKEREMDLKAGLETIASSSNDLIGFVQSYRELAGVARPIMKALMLDHLVNKVIGLTLEQCNEAGAVCTYCPKTDDILIYADESQIFRILINLIKNAVQAGAKHILITAEINMIRLSCMCGTMECQSRQRVRSRSSFHSSPPSRKVRALGSAFLVRSCVPTTECSTLLAATSREPSLPSHSDKPHILINGGEGGTVTE